MKRFFSLILTLTALMPALEQPALACACCMRPNHLLEFVTQDQLQFAEGVKLNGQMGLGNSAAEDDGLDVGTGSLSGQITKGLVSLNLSRKGKVLGKLMLKPTAKAIHRQMGMDFILNAAELKQLSPIEPGLEVYHMIEVPVRLDADASLKSALGVNFASQAVLRFYGRSNLCWSPADYGGQWSLNYALSSNGSTKGSADALARGSVLQAK